MFKAIIVLIFNITSLAILLGQSADDLNADQQNFIENYIESLDSEGEFDYATIFEDLSYFAEHPLDLNELDYDQLRRLYIFNDLQINAILDHRHRYGDYLEVYELQTVAGLSLDAIKSIQPFVTTNSSENVSTLSLSEMIGEASQTSYIKWRRVLEEQKGYTDEASENSRYLGDPNRLYYRHQIRYSDKLKIGFTAEKDEGEPIFNSLQKGFDFYSFHFHLRDYSYTLKDIVIGDYSINLGQGLILQNGFGTGKSTFVMDIKRGGRTVNSYSSVNESVFFRGGAMTLQLAQRLQLSLFASYKPIDANLNPELNDDGFGFFSSIIENGLHRSNNERNKVNTINATSFGGQISFQKKAFRINYNTLLSSFDKLYSRNQVLYNKFQFTGNKLLNQSIDYSFRHRNLSFFGESAVSDNLGLANVHGVLIGLNKIAELSILYRDYGVDYHSLAANAFGETTGTNNEKGTYIGFSLRPAKRFSINAYGDMWKHPWLRFRRDAPSGGSEFLVKLDYNVKRKLNLYTQYKYEQKEINAEEDTESKVDILTPIRIERWRTHLSYLPSKKWELRSRVEFSRYRQESQSDIGYLVYQDLIFKSSSFPISFSSRIAYFNTPGFDSRIYAYENDLLYEFFVPFYADEGFRYYANMRYRLSRNITAEFRYAQTRYLDRETISSGNNLINGNIRTQLKAQIRIRI